MARVGALRALAAAASIALGIAGCGEAARQPFEAGALLVADDVGNVVWRVTASPKSR